MLLKIFPAAFPQHGVRFLACIFRLNFDTGCSSARAQLTNLNLTLKHQNASMFDVKPNVYSVTYICLVMNVKAMQFLLVKPSSMLQRF